MFIGLYYKSAYLCFVQITIYSINKKSLIETPLTMLNHNFMSII